MVKILLKKDVFQLSKKYYSIKINEYKKSILGMTLSSILLIVMLYLLICCIIGVESKTSNYKSLSSVTITYTDYTIREEVENVYSKISDCYSIDYLNYSIPFMRLKENFSFGSPYKVYYPSLIIDDSVYEYKLTFSNNQHTSDTISIYKDNLYSLEDEEYLNKIQEDFILYGKIPNKDSNELLISSNCFQLLKSRYNLNEEDILGKNIAYTVPRKYSEGFKNEVILENYIISGIYNSKSPKFEFGKPPGAPPP